MEINLFLTNPSKYMIHRDTIEKQKNHDQEITGLTRMVNFTEVIINSLVYANDYGELKRDPAVFKEISIT